MTILLNTNQLPVRLKTGLKQLEIFEGFEIHESGYVIKAVANEEKILCVNFENSEINIHYPSEAAFYRGIGHVLQAIANGKDELSLIEPIQFNMNGLMFDCSRNAVLNIKTVEKLLRKLALLGQNTFMLYMEDTYEIKEQLYFGYRRGRFSHEELKHIDAYALNLGIEVIPCIQTLAHLNQFFRWDTSFKYKDMDDILLVGDDAVHELIHQMFSNLSACFTSHRIHVGMDEAYNLGRGRYLDRNGYTSKVEIMQQHLKKVREIASTYEKEIIIWDDMFYRDYAVRDAKSDIELDNVNLMYWDYYSEDPKHYRSHILKRKQLTDHVMFAGGAWKWIGYVPHHTKTLDSTNASLSICKELGVKDVIVTSWGDDGSESPADSCLFGTVLFAEHGYHEQLDFEQFKQKLEFITGIPYDIHMAIEKIDMPLDPSTTLVTNVSKYVLYQDPMVSLCDEHLKHLNLTDYFIDLKHQLAPFTTHPTVLMYDVMLDVLIDKWDLGLQLKTAYDSKNEEALRELVVKMKNLIPKVENFKAKYAAVWKDCYKLYGYEIIDIRLSGIVARLNTTISYLEQYLNHDITNIELLEEATLPYYEGKEGLITLNQYGLIISASRITW